MSAKVVIKNNFNIFCVKHFSAAAEDPSDLADSHVNDVHFDSPGSEEHVEDTDSNDNTSSRSSERNTTSD